MGLRIVTFSVTLPPVNSATDPTDPTTTIFAAAEWYDRSINWQARFARELPVLTDVFGPPGKRGLIDAGCGTGRHACALATRGYHVAATDMSEEMLRVAEQRAAEEGVAIQCVRAPYASLHDAVGGDFDGLFCLGNALAAAGDRASVSDAIGQFGECLRAGGRMLVQILNFAPMRAEQPCVRGPRVALVDGREYVSVRVFDFAGDAVIITNVTIWHDDDGWKKHARRGRLYPICLDEMRRFCETAGLRVDHVWGGYGREDFDKARSTDVIVVATKI